MSTSPLSAAILVRPMELSGVAPSAHAAIVGDLVFTAGSRPLDPDGEVIGIGDVRRQARSAMTNLVTTLGAARCGLLDVVKITIFVASFDRNDLVMAWGVMRDSFGKHDPPGTLLGVAQLGFPGQLVEIEAVALRRV